MLKLWGRISSINVQKVVWCLDELGLAYERVDIGGPFGMTPEYRRLNPNALVPTLQDGDFTLWESNAIVRYLSGLHPEAGLMPADPKVRADSDRWMDWQATNATPAMRDAFWQIVRTPADQRDATALATSVAASARNAAILDARLADRPYVAGAAFTVGDIPLACHINRWLLLPIERPPLPRLEAWWARVKARPGGQTVTALPLT